MTDFPQALAPRHAPVSAGTDLQSAVASFAAPVFWRSLLQLASSVGLFLAACVAMHLVYPHSYALMLLMAVPTGALLVRVFIVQHDCGHGAFFRSRVANTIVGRVCAVLTLTPYANWRRQHALHHATWNNLDRRQSGADIYSSCLTVHEYEALPRLSRLAYRCLRHPLIANLLLPPLVFLVLYRIPFDTPRTWRRERRSVYLTNISILGVLAVISVAVGPLQVLLVQVPVMVVASIIGVLLFSLQHRFEAALWARQTAWSAASAALEASSYMPLPPVLRWFTGNIGFHHLHHLNPRVPNYRLKRCHETTQPVLGVAGLSLRGAWRSLWLTLWDEDSRRLVGFRQMHARRRRAR